MSALTGRRIVLGVSASIAAYKSLELTRLLRTAGAEVRVVLTRAATALVTPLSFQALSGHPVRQDLLDPAEEAGMDHIGLARWADIVVIAPASADVLARLALGLADDLLTTLCLATTAPVVVAPAMNRVMWQADATRENRARLERRGVTMAGPGVGEQACGEQGAGRMLEPAAVMEIVAGVLARAREGGALSGEAVLITAGPTREALDPVRYLGNRSSGKMGFALAAAAARAGAEVTVIAGPVGLDTPPGVTRVDVISAAEMLAAVRARIEHTGIFIGAAAVADYRPVRYSEAKLKKDGRLVFELEQTEDILATVARGDPRPFTVGFAAETEDLLANAEKKLASKNLDLVAANRVGAAGPGIESDDNALTLLWPGGRQELPLAPKEDLAGSLVEVIAARCRARRG